MVLINDKKTRLEKSVYTFNLNVSNQKYLFIIYYYMQRNIKFIRARWIGGEKVKEETTFIGDVYENGE